MGKEEVEATLASLSPHPPWGTPPRTQADPVVSDKSHTPANGLLEVLLGLGLGGQTVVSGELKRPFCSRGTPGQTNRARVRGLQPRQECHSSTTE